MSAQPQAFDVTGPLPDAGMVLEASAGTGKTWSIAALTARHVAEGTSLERLLLVTFTRAATGELRERIRSRLLGVSRGLQALSAGFEPAEEDPVVGLLAAGSDEEIAVRRRRVERALSDFDAATITTIHGFCMEALGGLGIVGDIDRGDAFTEDLSDLLDQVADDLYVRRFYSTSDPVLDPGQARQIARFAMSRPLIPIVAATAEPAAMRGRLADAARKLLEERKRRLGLMGYDDLLTRLASALRGELGDVAAARLRERWDVALVDEFQDTDPVQWEIVRAGFAERGATTVLVGDPKQAIYAFRGADVYSYLDAHEAAATKSDLGTNYRSDRPLLEAYDALFSGADLGHPGISYRSVEAAPDHQQSALSGTPCATPLRVRCLERGQFGRSGRRTIGADAARAWIAADVAADIVELLSSGGTIARGGSDEEEVMPRHVAVLVRSNREAADVRNCLGAAGVPAVISGAGSVFSTEVADEWRRLLAAIDRPSSRVNARSAALTCFFGWTAGRLAEAEDSDTERIHRSLHRYGRVLRERGVAAMVEEMSAVEGIPARVLALRDGERTLTDLRHIAQLLHAEVVNQGRGVSALAAWLNKRVEEAPDDLAEERSRRLESDAEAVQVLTIHRSKGLEFPIVYVPYLWTGGRKIGTEPVSFHDTEGEHRIDVSLEGEEYERNKQTAWRERLGEDLRLAYVALTRARHQAVLWWCPGWKSGDSAAGRLLFGRRADGSVLPGNLQEPADAEARKKLEALAAKAPERISIERSEFEEGTRWEAPVAEPEKLEVASFERSLDASWRRASYSSMAAAPREEQVASEPGTAGTVDDEPSGEEPPPPEGERPPPDALESPMAELPGGRSFGTLVHGVLEDVDFSSADIDADLRESIELRRPAPALELDAGELAGALRLALETPLDPILDGLCLRDVAAEDRLNELEFELPLVGGDEPAGSLTVAAIGRLLAERLPEADPFGAYGRTPSAPETMYPIRGYLTGSIDLVLRTTTSTGAPRFAIVDYKTNWLGAVDTPLTCWHYRPEALGAEMARGYALQASLYSVALHRYLRWRLPDYDPDLHVAGVLYLFVRGMAGERTPRFEGSPAGVFSWRPPNGLVEELSTLLDGGSES